MSGRLEEYGGLILRYIPILIDTKTDEKISISGWMAGSNVGE